jgi:hypoxanthine phosphoribosyltransferase
MLAHLLATSDFCTLGVRTTASEGVRATRHIPKVYDAHAMPLVAGKQVLLVDDVVNTGRTLAAAAHCIEGFACRALKSAAAVWDTVDVDTCQADFFGLRADGWVVFPWEE